MNDKRWDPALTDIASWYDAARVIQSEGDIELEIKHVSSRPGMFPRDQQLFKAAGSASCLLTGKLLELATAPALSLGVYAVNCADTLIIAPEHQAMNDAIRDAGLSELLPGRGGRRLRRRLICDLVVSALRQLARPARRPRGC